jgi:hypothetical protein
MKKYLQVSDVIDWQHPAILEFAEKIKSRHQTSAVSALTPGVFCWAGAIAS